MKPGAMCSQAYKLSIEAATVAFTVAVAVRVTVIVEKGGVAVHRALFATITGAGMGQGLSNCETGSLSLGAVCAS